MRRIVLLSNKGEKVAHRHDLIAGKDLEHVVENFVGFHAGIHENFLGVICGSTVARPPATSIVIAVAIFTTPRPSVAHAIVRGVSASTPRTVRLVAAEEILDRSNASIDKSILNARDKDLKKCVLNETLVVLRLERLEKTLV